MNFTIDCINSLAGHFSAPPTVPVPQDNNVVIRFRDVYGKRNIYILSYHIRHISQLSKKVTVNLDDLKSLKSLGFSIVGYGAEENEFINQNLK